MSNSPRSRKVRQMDDIPVEIDAPSSVDFLEYVSVSAAYTAPDFSLFFLVFFAIAAYLHESYVYQFAGIMIVWCFVQLAGKAIDPEFRANLFWSILRLIGNFAFYLFLGYLWSLVKLYLDVWQGHLPAAQIAQMKHCVSAAGQPGCIIDIILTLKWNIVQWMITWPVSMTYSLCRDPVRIVTDLLFEWSQKRYAAIISAALSADSVNELSWWWLVYIVAYIAVGWIWTHFKLYIDVWCGDLYAAELDQISANNGSYVDFVRLRIRAIVSQWLISWPFSLIYTILRKPVRIAFDLVYDMSIKTYAMIIETAMKHKRD
jgi:hypothetical protein